MYQNLVEVIACVIPNLTITLSKVYTRRTIENGLIRNAKVNFKTEVTDWKTNDYNTHVAPYLKT